MKFTAELSEVFNIICVNYMTILKGTDADTGAEEEPEYQTPPTCDLLSLLLKNRRPTGAVNEVWPNLYVGNA